MKCWKGLISLLLLSLVSATVFAQIKNVYGPYLQNVKENEATIVWEADKNSVGWVEIAPNDGSHFYGEDRPKFFDVTSGVKNASFLHTVKIKGLKPGVTYRYRVCSQEILSRKGNYLVYGSIATRDMYLEKPWSFTTCDYHKKETSFLMVNDIHAKKGLITELMNVGDFKKKDFIIYNGDMVSILRNKEDLFDGFMNESVEVFASDKMMCYVRGNHETRGEYATSVQKYFNPKEPHLYYLFRQGPVCFIMLDTGEDKPDSSTEYSGITDYDNYRTEQMEWMKTIADDDLFKTAKFKVAIAHMPPSKAVDIWHGQKEVLNKFVPILNELGIDLMMCGHLHRHDYEEPSSLIHFPVLVNSNTSVVSVNVSEDRLNLVVMEKDGKVVRKESYPAK